MQHVHETHHTIVDKKQLVPVTFMKRRPIVRIACEYMQLYLKGEKF